MTVGVKHCARLRGLVRTNEVDARLDGVASVTRLIETVCDTSKRQQPLLDSGGTGPRKDVLIRVGGRRTLFVGRGDAQFRMALSLCCAAAALRRLRVSLGRSLRFSNGM